jgi:Metallo-peptidase family M12
MEDQQYAGVAVAPLNAPIMRDIPVPPFLAWSTFAAQFLTFGYVVAHEWGHNLGCYHDRGTEDQCGDKINTNYGYRSPSGTFRTIMAYPCTSGECDAYNNSDQFCARIPYFSGPATFQNGESLGGEENNCRARIKNHKRFIARNRGGSPYGDMDG